MATAATAAALAASLLLSASRVRRQRAGAPPSLLAARRLTATFRRSQATGVLFSTGYNRSVFHCLSLSFHRLSTALLAPDTAFALRAGGAWHRWLRSSCTGHPARPGAPDKTRHTLTLYSTACGSESGGWEPGWALMTDLSRRNVAAAAAAAAAAAPGTLPHNPDGALLISCFCPPVPLRRRHALLLTSASSRTSIAAAFAAKHHDLPLQVEKALF